MVLGNPVDDFHKFFDFLISIRNLHPLAAQHIGRTYQNGIAQAVGHFPGLLSSKYRAACRPRDFRLLQNFIE